MEALKISAKYQVKKIFMAGYFLLILVGVFLILSYLFEFFKIGFIKQFTPDFYFHVSNFSISIIFYLGIGYSWMIQGVKFRYIAVLGAAMVIANVACETVMGFMNTTDLVDAVYGIIGTAIGFVYMTLIYKYGLIPWGETDPARGEHNE